MGIQEAFDGLHDRDLWLVIIGVATLAAAVLPRLLEKHPFSVPLLLVALGAISNPLGLEELDPRVHGEMAERITELTVIISLMGAGLKLDRPVGWKRWSSTWRLLGITMILSIAMVAFVGWAFAAFVPAAAILLGACIASTDPVLASDVQVGPPGMSTEEEAGEHPDETGEGKEDEVRFALTSEAGLNDGLAFPFTNMAIAMVVFGANPRNWFGTWLLMDVLYQVGIGVLGGILLGKLMARAILKVHAKTELARAVMGLGSVAATLVIYGATEYMGGYGFIATFVGALAIRNYERGHQYQKTLHQFSEMAERLMFALVLVGFGAAIMSGLLKPLTWPLIFTAIIIVLFIRPVAGAIGMIGFNKIPWRERWAISFLGIRGIGSFYYLSYALNQAEFEDTRELWAVVGLVVLLSIVIHGAAAEPIIRRMDALRRQEPARLVE